MRVFELMEQLSKMPAGAEVEFSTLVTVKELIDNDALDIEGETAYRLQCAVVEVDKAADKHIYLYSD